jgi:glycine/D-amino acid oxidase-like deaminating enzyme
VIEAHSIGWGASSRNGGMLIPGLQLGMGTIARRYGPKMAGEFWEWSLAAIDHVGSMVRSHNIDCAFARTGHLHLAYKPSHVKDILHEIEYLRSEYSYNDPRFIPMDDLKAEIGSNVFFGAIVDDTTAALDPAQYVFGLAQAAAEAGVLLVENTKVTGLEQNSNSVIVQSKRGPIRADQVLLATNGYTGNLLPKARRGVFPVGSYIIVTEPLSQEVQKEIAPNGRMFYDSKNFLNYFRLTPDGRLLFGGRNDFSTDLDLAKSAQRLQQRMVEVFPQLVETRITHSWTGKLGVTFDLMPHIFQSGRIRGAYGYCGHGVAVASYLGKEVGEIIAGSRVESLFAQIPHPRSVFAPFHRLYLPFAAQWYRFLDTVS